jgi:hypothetical protein
MIKDMVIEIYDPTRLHPILPLFICFSSRPSSFAGLFISSFSAIAQRPTTKPNKSPSTQVTQPTQLLFQCAAAAAAAVLERLAADQQK